MASVSVLVLNDLTVAPHLELLRRVCDPRSRSKPHITVRYFDRLRVPRDHLDTVIGHVDLLRPATFNSDGPAKSVVFIQCAADELIGLEHKPHFPGSEFHITLYDGNQLKFANELLATLQRFSWMFRVQLPPGTTLTQVHLKRPGNRHTRRPRLSAGLRELFLDIAKQELTWRLLDRLTTRERLYLVHEICQHLHQVTTQLTPLASLVVTDVIKEREAGGTEPTPAVHLTPPELATSIATYALSLLGADDTPIHFGDPAVGNGAFYAALLQQLPRERIASAVGVDISPRQAEVARGRWGHRGLEILRADYLHLERLQPRTLILANPPYLRHQDIPVDYKRRLRERASVVADTLVDAKSGQYVYFLILSHRWLADGGIAAWLVPSGFMCSQYGGAVRRYLTKEVELIRIHQFDVHDPQFENAKVLPAVVVFRKVAPEPAHKATLSVGGSLDSPERSRLISVRALRNEEKWSAIAPQVSPDEVDLCIGDLFSVRRGIATGANDFFVLPRMRALALGLPDIALRPILPKSRQLTSDIVERKSDGWPRVEPELCVIDCELSEEEIAGLYPRLGEYLATARDRGILERNLVRSRRLWYHQEERQPASFLCTYMGRGNANRLPLRFIWNKSDAIATNAYLMLYPNSELANALKKGPDASEDVFALLRRAAATTIGRLSRTYSGGLQKIEPRDLLRVGLPAPPKWLRQIRRVDHADSRLWIED